MCESKAAVSVFMNTDYAENRCRYAVFAQLTGQ
jgi:hypothetical protein